MGNVLVIGGGTAGTAAALALHKAGFDVTVYEAHADAAEDIGAFLTLASNGMRALAQIDASAAVTALGFPLTGMRVLDGSGAEVASRPLGEARDPVLRYRCMRRGDLNAALQAEVLCGGITIRHGARLVSVQDGPDSVTAHFADGSTATGDLLIGADGLHSTVRRFIAPAADPRYAGEQVFYGYTTDASLPEDTEDTERITFSRSSSAAFGHAVSPAGETYWFARVAGEPLPPEEVAAGTPARWRDLLVPLLREDASLAAGIVAATAGDILVTTPPRCRRRCRGVPVGRCSSATRRTRPRRPPGKVPPWRWRTPSSSRRPSGTHRTPRPRCPSTRPSAAPVWNTTSPSAARSPEVPPPPARRHPRPDPATTLP